MDKDLSEVRCPKYWVYIPSAALFLSVAIYFGIVIVKGPRIGTALASETF